MDSSEQRCRQNLAYCSVLLFIGCPKQYHLTPTHNSGQLRILTPFCQVIQWGKVRNTGTTRGEQPGRNSDTWDRLFRKGTGAESLRDFIPLWGTTFCLASINPDGSQEQPSQTACRRPASVRWAQQPSLHFTRQYFQWAGCFLDSLFND